MNVAEKHDNILVKNYNARPVGTKPIPESNHSRAPNGGRKERNPKDRDFSGRSGPYSHSNKEGNHQNRRRRNRIGQKREGANASGLVGGATNTKSYPNDAFNAPQSMGSEHRDKYS